MRCNLLYAMKNGHGKIAVSMLLFAGIVQMLLAQIVWGSSQRKIAIIGGGIGGTSCAYFLREAFQENASISILERDTIGGRLATTDFDGDEYETGATAFHVTNQYMMDFTKLLGLRPSQHPGLSMGIFNGEKFVFEDSEWSFITLSRLYWRYGWDVFRQNSFASSLLDEFSKIYKLQDKGIAYTSVMSLLDSLSTKFPNMTQQTLRSYLKEHNFADIFIDEFVQAITLRNFGQTVDVNAFVGAVSLAWSDSGRWHIHGGNKQVPSGLLSLSAAEVISADVSTVTYLGDQGFELAYRQAGYNVVERQRYDTVVVATPLMEEHTNIQFNNFSKDFDQYFKPYQRTVTTFVQGKIKPSAFSSVSVPDVILTNADAFLVNSISRTTPVTGKATSRHKVYQMCTKLPLSVEQINILFDDVKLTKMKDWMACPQYETPVSIPPFVLYPNLYYINGIEWLTSEMEMSIISGRNVALLISNTWMNRFDLINPDQRLSKDEL